MDVTFGSTPEIADHHVPLVGKGPAVGTGSILSRKMAREIMAAAQEEGIGYQVEVLSGRGTGTNADSIVKTRTGVESGCVSIPLRYMHTPIEVIDPKDVENTARLLAAYAKEDGTEHKTGMARTALPDRRRIGGRRQGGRMDSGPSAARLQGMAGRQRQFNL